ncbi:GrlR family regulatory protein [Ancylobacter sp.]|uniref:GrlR family regulatory protein n=1 Tax=Ancylobacter sp. TaxID=1872567 RepID=UPI003D0A2532
MSLDGFYKVQFATPLGAGAGVVVLREGTIEGGDSALFYKGTYSLNGNQFTATVSTGRHTHGLDSVFGKDNVTINLHGEVSAGHLRLQGSAPAAPGVPFTAELQKL